MKLRGTLICLALFMACKADEVCTPDGTCSVLDREKAYSLFLAGNDLYNAGDLVGAVKEYRAALKHDPQHADTLCNMGSALQDLGEPGESVDLYLRAVDANPYHATAHFNLAILLHEEDLDTAIEHYQAAIEADPTMADAWANLGSAMHQLQEYENAVNCYQEAIGLYEAEDSSGGLNEQFLPALFFQLGTALSSLPNGACVDGTCSEHAVEQLRKALRLDPNNVLAQHSLAVLLADPALATASPEYVKRLFDDYAATFDDSLAGLKYQAPELLREVLGELVEPETVFSVVFDAGCGTGLCGPLFRGMAKKLVGADLSPKMIEVAKGRDVYNELAVGEVGEEMIRRAIAGEKADLILAADVLVYIGDLREVIGSAADYSRDGGLFAFTLEKLDDPCGFDFDYDEEIDDDDEELSDDSSGESKLKLKKEGSADSAEGGAPASTPDAGGMPRSRECKGWALTASGRFAHTREYVVNLAREVGFAVWRHEIISPRFEGGKPVLGHLFVLRKGPEAELPS